MELVQDTPERVFPVGRLDEQKTGMLIVTNDGDFAYKLTHPKHELSKTYLVQINGIISKEKITKLCRGVDIGGYITAPAKIEVVKQSAKSAILEVRISEGKNRQVRKMFAAVGCRVKELERTAIGDVRLGRLKQGHLRKMTRGEIESLRGE